LIIRETAWGEFSNRELLSRNTYAREASQTEVETWVKVLAGGKTRGALLLDFTESPFYKENTASRATAALLFTLCFAARHSHRNLITGSDL
jgi:hypothetical protein